MLIEGLRLVRDAWQAGVRPVVLFVAPDMVAQNPPRWTWSPNAKQPASKFWPVLTPS